MQEIPAYLAAVHVSGQRCSCVRRGRRGCAVALCFVSRPRCERISADVFGCSRTCWAASAGETPSPHPRRLSGPCRSSPAHALPAHARAHQQTRRRMTALPQADGQGDAHPAPGCEGWRAFGCGRTALQPTMLPVPVSGPWRGRSTAYTYAGRHERTRRLPPSHACWRAGSGVWAERRPSLALCPGPTRTGRGWPRATDVVARTRVCDCDRVRERQTKASTAETISTTGVCRRGGVQGPLRALRRQCRTRPLPPARATTGPRRSFHSNTAQAVCAQQSARHLPPSLT